MRRRQPAGCLRLFSRWRYWIWRRLSRRWSKRDDKALLFSRLLCSYQLTYFLQSRMRITAACALVAVALGLRGPLSVPLIIPALTAQFRASSAKIGDLVIVRIFPNDHAALDGVIVPVLGVAVQDGWSRGQDRPRLGISKGCSFLMQ